MCGRFTLRTPVKEVASLFEGLVLSEFKARFNIAPTQDIAAVRMDKEGAVHAAEFRWGLVPSWAKGLNMGAKMINARCETISEKPSFRTAFKKRRCLIFADGFYEWKKSGSSKLPFYITLANDKPFCMAGLWERWTGAEGERVESCTVITTAANALMEPLHNRMPVILNSNDYEMWLDPRFENREQLAAMLVPFESDDMAVREVSQIVNKATNETPACIEPIKRLFT